MRLVPGSPADGRLERALPQQLADWGDGALGPRDKRPLELDVVHWIPRHPDCGRPRRRRRPLEFVDMCWQQEYFGVR
jgi:hypothetical protein